MWATKAWVLLHNNTAEDINLTFFTIYGDVLYRYKLNTMETQGAKNPKEYESTYIYDEAQAERFVQFYWHFLQTSRYQFTWSEPCRWNELNEVVAVGIKGNGSTQKALIASKKSKWINGNTEVLTYTAIGVDTYTPATLVPTVIVPSTAKQTAIRPSLTATFASTPSFTLSQWETYGTPGAPQTWAVTNASSFKPGYIALVLGEISDLDDTPVTLYMDVTAVDTVNGTISGTGIRIDYTVPVDVDNWDFAIEQSAVPRNDRIPWNPNDSDSYTDIHLTSLQKGYGVLEYWSCDGTSSPMLTCFVGANSKTTTGSTPVLRIYKQETYAEIKVTMHSLDNTLSITKVIKINNETEYDHDFGAWEPTDDGTHIFVLPDHFTVGGIDYDIIDGDFFVAAKTFAVYSEGSAVTPSGTENPANLGWYERKGSGTNAKPYYWLLSTDTSVDSGKTYGTVSGQAYLRGVPYMFQNNSWHNEMQATAANSQRMLRSLATVLNSPATQPSVGALYGWFRDLVALNAVIQNLTAINLNVGPGTGLAGSGFRFRALDNNGSPIFDVMYGADTLFSVDISTGKIYFGAGFWYDPSDGAIHSTGDNVVISGAGEISAKGASIIGASVFHGSFNCDVIRTALRVPSLVGNYSGSSGASQAKTIIDSLPAGYAPTYPTTYTTNYSTYYPAKMNDSGGNPTTVAYVRFARSKITNGAKVDSIQFFDSSFTQLDIKSFFSCTATGSYTSANTTLITNTNGGTVTGFYANSTVTISIYSGGNALEVDIPDQYNASGLTTGQLFHGAQTTVNGVTCYPIYMKA